MDIEKVPGIKENLLRSENIFNLIANLYYLCATEFVTIYNLLQDDQHKSKFLNYFHNYKQELLEKCDDLLGSDYEEIIGVLRRLDDFKGEEFLIGLWAYLKSIDFIFSGDRVYLDTITPVRCRTSDYFGAREFLLFFKPNNLIFETIKDKSPEGKLKIGFNIGQRIEDHLQKLILYEENLSRKIEFRKIDPLVNELLLEKSEKLAFAIAPIFYDFDYSFKSFNSSRGVPYVFGEIKNKETIARAIDHVLNKCIKKNVNVVVFPELTIDEELRDYISNWLKLNNIKKKIIMVVAGSYHVLKDGKKNRYENICTVYRFDGKKLWEQKKMNQFQLDEDDIKKLLFSELKGFRSFKELFGASDTKGWEKIQISNTLKIYDSSIGRMAVAICLDYFVKEKEKLLIEPNVNIIFVPAMSWSLKRMDISNFDFGTFGLASIFCANSCWIITGGEKGKFDKANSSYIYIPQKGGLKHMGCRAKYDCFNCSIKIFRVSQISKRHFT